MIQEIQVRVLPVVASSEQNIKRFVAEDRGIDIRTINAVRVLKRSIDARQRKIFINLTVRLYINEMPEDDAYVVTEYGDVSGKPAVIVVGEGPGGLFASLRLIELGLRPIVLERGKNVRDRKVDLANIKKKPGCGRREQLLLRRRWSRRLFGRQALYTIKEAWQHGENP